MTQHLLLIQNNTKTETTPAEWDVFIAAAKKSGLFQGGSALGERVLIGDTQSAQSTKHVGDYMRFDADDKAKILELLKKHPVVMHGGSVELCEMPKT